MDCKFHEKVLNQLLNDNEILLKLISVLSVLNKVEGTSNIIPNKLILLNTLAIQESKSSNEIEGIITTNNENYKSISNGEEFYGNAKEIINYNKAVTEMTELLSSRPVITNQSIILIQSILEPNKSGIRKGPVSLKDINEKIIYTPPTAEKVELQLTELTNFLNGNLKKGQATAVLAAIIGHHFFETIHPFNDGNGRTGRILIITSLVYSEIITQPYLFVSRYVNNNKSSYYYLLQKVRDKNTIESWKEFVLFYLDAFERSSKQCQVLIENINMVYNKIKGIIEKEFGNVDILMLDLLFEHPFFLRKNMEEKMSISKATALRRINKLIQLDIIKKSEDDYYVVKDLYELFDNEAIDDSMIQI